MGKSSNLHPLPQLECRNVTQVEEVQILRERATVLHYSTLHTFLIVYYADFYSTIAVRFFDAVTILIESCCRVIMYVKSNVFGCQSLLTFSSPVLIMYTVRTAKFNIQKCCVLPTQCIYVFCVDLRTNSDYFPVQH